jgi:glycosyltransferase involved in cell wall biosynthesis
LNRRILFVVDSLFPLGPALQLEMLANGLADLGDEVHIAALDEPADTPLAANFPAATVYGLYKGIIRGSRQLVLAARLRKLIRSVDPEIVHGWGQPASTIACLAPYRLEPVRFLCTQLWECPDKRLRQHLLGRQFGQTPETIVVTHECLRDRTAESAARHNVNSRVIPNAAPIPISDRVASRQLLRDRLEIPTESWVAGTAAPLTPRTRLKDLIWATDQLACFRDDVHLVIFGKGEQDSRLKRFLSLTEATPYVHFLGVDPDARSLINGVDFYWHSHLREPLPTGLLQAMAGKIPVISVYGPQTADLIVPQTTGLAANLGTRVEFARWTKYLIEQRDAAAQLAQQGQDHVLARYPVEQMVQAYLETYQMVLENV